GEWTLPQDATGVVLKNVPEGWNVSLVNEPPLSMDKSWLYTVSSPDGKISVTYRFTVPHVYTVDELKGVTATVDGEPVEGFDPTQTGTWTIPHGAAVSLEGIPSDWVTTHEDGTLVWAITAPDNSVSVTWTFEQEQPASSTDDLKGVTATVDGIPVDNFDPTQSGTWLVPSGSTVSLSGIPSDWQVTHEKGTLTWTVTSPDGSLSVTWTFEEERPTPSKDDLNTVTATVDGKPVEGFDPVNGGTFPVPAGTTSVDLDGIPEGWNATPMQDGLGFTMTSEDGSITVEYVFQPETIIHTVTFDYGIEGMTGSQQVTDGGKATEPVAPVRDGYRFDGWLLDGQTYDFATPVTGDITLTAGWTINTYTVRFDTAGGSSVPEQAIDHGQKITEPAAPTREGYTFTGWLLDGRPFDFSTPITGNLTLTAGWQENEPPAPVTHTVTFDSAGGSTIPAQTVTDGAAAIDPGTPTRDGYTFTGWLLDGKPFDFATPITGDITLTAGWEESGEPAPTIHTVTFDDGTGNTVTVNVQEGETVQEPSAPSRDGYEFTGWLLDGTPYDFTTPVTGDITLTAGWEKTEEPVTTFTVSFRTNGGTAVEQQTITEGGTVEKPMDPTRDGYTFTGWLLDGQPYDFTTPITGNIVLDAAWEQNTPIDELAGVTATVDGKPVEGFDPAKDGEYRIDEGAKVELNGVPEGWTVIRQETEDGYMFTLTNGERTVAYTFAATQGQETDTPGEPDGSTPADSGDTKTDVPGDEDRKDGLADTGASIGIVVSVLASAACLGAGIHLFRRTHRDRR
ncbi:InlB B-repeat-containing protein, partial [Pseudoflavonifractor sp. An85]|uniref:InlB B-repeat-containing protein n=1 Tax=Pseudoflavonifractor sp. An85 TaxID=1965661 RepID=UPI000B57765B